MKTCRSYLTRLRDILNEEHFNLIGEELADKNSSKETKMRIQGRKDMLIIFDKYLEAVIEQYDYDNMK